MAQEFIIKSQAIEDKINQLLPSQGGFQAGVDFSASTQVIPIVDLTETAEGSSVRPDLQTALSLTSITSFTVSNTTSTLINTTGYFRVFGVANGRASAGNLIGTLDLSDGLSTKTIVTFTGFSATDSYINETYDFIVYIKAGESLSCTSNSGNLQMSGNTRQIADLSGNLVNPL